MRGFGFTLVALGVLGFLAGIGMDTSVSGGIGAVNRVVNIGLLSQQTATLTVSSLLFMTGCILVGLAAVRDTIERLGTNLSAQSVRPAPLQPTTNPAQPPPTANRPDSVGWSTTKTCPKCYALSSAEAAQCTRCGREFEKVGEIVAGSRVHHLSFGAGTVQVVDGNTATVLFDGRDGSMPMSLDYLKMEHS